MYNSLCVALRSRSYSSERWISSRAGLKVYTYTPWELCIGDQPGTFISPGGGTGIEEVWIYLLWIYGSSR